MAVQSAQTEKGMAQMREQQAESQQAQSKFMQMLGMIFVGQEQQRLTNGWAAGSIATISTSSGVAIEAAPEQQAAITMPPALVRSSEVVTAPEPMVTDADASSGSIDAGLSSGRLQRCCDVEQLALAVAL